MSTLACLVCVMLVPLAAAGLALIHQGLGRSRSAAHAMLTVLCAMGTAAIIFVMFGSAWAGFPGDPSHTFTVVGYRWDWLGAGQFFPHGSNIEASRGSDITRSLLLCLEMFAAGFTAMIPVGAGTDRWRIVPACLASAAIAGIIFPLFAHGAWGGGWLAQLGAEFGLSAFVDPGGAGVIQVLGGLTALCVAWIAGARKGKFADDGMATAIPGHNIVLVLFGCMLALVGWAGLELATGMIVYGSTPEQLVWAVINATLSASGGCIAALVITGKRYHKPDASLAANGWIAGLVASSAACAMVSPAAATGIGILAGAISIYTIELFELRLLVDDPGGSISVHAGAGLWGLAAVGIFGRFSEGTRSTHILAQLIGVAALLGFMLPLIYVVNLLLNRISPYRVDNDGEWQGMDVRELGAGAYPEFVVHADDFVPR